MKTTDVLIRSEKGQQEVEQRLHKLAGRMRMLLLLVDGRRQVQSLIDQAVKIGLPSESVDDLLTHGFVVAANKPAAAESRKLTTSPQAQRPDDWQQYRQARQFMTDTIVDAVGLKSFFFNLKIEKTATLADLTALSNDYDSAMTKALGKDAAEPFITRMKELLL